MDGIPIVPPHAIFTVASLQATLGLKKGSLPREIRLKRLKAHKRCGRYFILGADVLAWLAGEPAAHQFTGGNTP